MFAIRLIICMLRDGSLFCRLLAKTIKKVHLVLKALTYVAYTFCAEIDLVVVLIRSTEKTKPSLVELFSRPD